MLVIKQNGRSKLGRTGNGIHMEINNNIETLNAVWPTAEQAGWRSVHMTVLILCAPGFPSSLDPLLETPLPKGGSALGKGIEKVSSRGGAWNLSCASFPGPVSLGRDKPT